MMKPIIKSDWIVNSTRITLPLRHWMVITNTMQENTVYKKPRKV